MNHMTRSIIIYKLNTAIWHFTTPFPFDFVEIHSTYTNRNAATAEECVDHNNHHDPTNFRYVSTLKKRSFTGGLPVALILLSDTYMRRGSHDQTAPEV
jgi:hypothetical protein